MPRLFPRPYEGLHPAYPKPPEPLPANPWTSGVFIFGSFGGLLWSAGRSLIGSPSFGSSIRATAICTVATAALAAVNEFGGHKNEYSLLQKVGIEPGRRVIFEYTANRTLEDYVVAGAGLGLLVALRRRSLPGAAGWQRYVGAASLGGSAGSAVFAQMYSERLGVAKRQQAEALARAVSIRKNHTDLSESPASTFRGVTPANVSSAHAPHKNQLDTPPTALGILEASSPAGSLGHQVVLQQVRTVQEGTPGSAPFCFSVVDDEVEWAPSIDYLWTPRTTEEGIKLLQALIEDFECRTRIHVCELTYLTQYIEEKERQFFKETDPSSKVIQRKALGWLTSLHCAFTLKHWEYIWMCSQASKRINQFENPDQPVGESSVYQPKTERTKDERSHPLEMTLKELRSHKQYLEHVISLLEAPIMADDGPAEPPDSPREHTLTELQQNQIATELLIDDLESFEKSLGVRQSLGDGKPQT